MIVQKTSNIPQCRFIQEMAMALPGIMLYGVALFDMQGFITGERQRKA